MASGRLGALKPAAATWKTAYKPSGAVAVVAISICNQATSDDAFWIAVAQSASTDPTPATTEYIAGGTNGSLIKAVGDASFADRAMFGPFELNSANNDQIVVKSNGGNVSFVVTGDEGTA